MRRSAVALSIAGVATAAVATLVSAGASTASARAATTRPTITVAFSPGAVVEYHDTVAARVLVTGAKGPATGKVDIAGLPGGTCASAKLVAGRATCTIYGATGVGDHLISVKYRGSSEYAAASKTRRVLLQPAYTRTSMTEAPVTTAKAGSRVTFSVLLNDKHGDTPKNGTVDIGPSVTKHDCWNRPVTNGRATCTTRSLPTGGHHISFVFSGASDFEATTSTVHYFITS